MADHVLENWDLFNIVGVTFKHNVGWDKNVAALVISDIESLDSFTELSPTILFIFCVSQIRPNIPRCSPYYILHLPNTVKKKAIKLIGYPNLSKFLPLLISSSWRSLIFSSMFSQLLLTGVFQFQFLEVQLGVRYICIHSLSNCINPENLNYPFYHSQGFQIMEFIPADVFPSAQINTFLSLLLTDFHTLLVTGALSLGFPAFVV